MFIRFQTMPNIIPSLLFGNKNTKRYIHNGLYSVSIKWSFCGLQSVLYKT